MRTKLIESNLPERYIHSVRNVDTVRILAGQPLVLNLSNIPQPPIYRDGNPPGREDGLQVVLSSTAITKPLGAQMVDLFHYGLAANDIDINQLGESLIFGVGFAAIVASSRASLSVTTWPAGTAIASGTKLAHDTTYNAFKSGGTTNNVIMLDDSPAFAGGPVATGDTRLVMLVLRRVLVREFD